MTDQSPIVLSNFQELFNNSEELRETFNPNADPDYFHFLVYGKTINIRNRFADILLDSFKIDGAPKSSDENYKDKLEYIYQQFQSGSLVSITREIESEFENLSDAEKLDALSNMQTRLIFDYLAAKANNRSVIGLAENLFAISTLITPLVDSENAHWISWQGLWRLSEEQVVSLKVKIKNDVRTLRSEG